MGGIVEDSEYESLISGSLSALNQTIEFDSGNKSQQGVYISGTWVGTITFEATQDGTNWFSVNGLNQSTLAKVTSTTSNGTFLLITTSFEKSRARLSSYVSGTVLVQNWGADNASAVYAIQADSWNINNISGTVTLPTGASTEATLSALNTKFNQDYGVSSGAIRVAAQVGNATGVAAFGAGTTSAQVLRVVLPTDQTAIPVTQSTSPWITKDQANGPVTPGTVASFSTLIGGQFNTTLPTLTTGQQSAIQTDSSGRIIIAPLTSASVTTASEDHNYGAVGANTLRVASQIGNATGAADFAAGNSSAQTLRVVIATNQSAVPISAAALPLPTGASTSALQTTGNTSLASILTAVTRAIGSTTTGQTGSLVMGAVTTAAPSYTTGQTDPLSLTTAGALRVDGSGVTQPISAASLPLPTNASTSALQTTGNTSLASIDGKLVDNYGVATGALRTASQVGNVAGPADFNAGTTTAQTLRVVLPTDQTAIPTTTGTPVYDVSNIYNYVSSVPSSTLTSVVTYTVPALKKAYLIRIPFSGQNIAQYQVLKNASVIDNQWTYFGGNLSGTFDFSSQGFGLPLVAGDVISLKVTHVRSFVADFNGRIFYIEMNA